MKPADIADRIKSDLAAGKQTALVELARLAWTYVMAERALDEVRSHAPTGGYVRRPARFDERLLRTQDARTELQIACEPIADALPSEDEHRGLVRLLRDLPDVKPPNEDWKRRVFDDLERQRQADKAWWRRAWRWIRGGRS